MPAQSTDQTPPQDLPALRKLVFSIAYRMLGSVADAEDVVQESFLRFHRSQADGTVVDSAKSYLAAIATRLAIDHLRSARVRREQYVGSWLPEPVIEEREPEATRHLAIAESLSMAFLLLLETLSPVGRPRFESSREKRDELARRFLAACEAGDLDGLVQLLAADATFYGDGGGKAIAILEPLHGRDRVARLLHGIFRKAQQIGVRMRAVSVNGQPGAITFDSQERVINVFAFDIVDDAVRSIRSVINPDKLQHLGTVSDWAKLPHSR